MPRLTAVNLNGKTRLTNGEPQTRTYAFWRYIMATEEIPLSKRVSTYFSQLSAVAADLNSISDQLGKSITEIDTALKTLTLADILLKAVVTANLGIYENIIPGQGLRPIENKDLSQKQGEGGTLATDSSKGKGLPSRAGAAGSSEQILSARSTATARRSLNRRHAPGYFDIVRVSEAQRARQR